MRQWILKLYCMLLIWGLSVPALAKESMATDPGQTSFKPGGVKSLEERVKQLEETIERTPQSDMWYDRILFSGLIEFEAGYWKIDYDDPAQADETDSDVDLAAFELAFDAKIATHVDGHVLLKYEDDEVFVDEGFITLSGSDAFPAYLVAGRQYIPFGNFDTHFITDPNTLLLGETNEGAVVAGYRWGGEMADISVGVFNGRANEAGDDDTIDSFVAGISVLPLESLDFGISYTSNLAGSDALSAVVADPDNLDALVGGWSAFVRLQFLERFNLIGEYVAALDKFKAGELYAADVLARKPSAWNLEIGVALAENMEVAVRYGGSDDGADFLPESQYGVVFNWGAFRNTNLAIEYLHDEFEDDVQQADTLTAQLAVEF